MEKILNFYLSLSPQQFRKKPTALQAAMSTCQCNSRAARYAYAIVPVLRFMTYAQEEAYRSQWMRFDSLNRSNVLQEIETLHGKKAVDAFERMLCDFEEVDRVDFSFLK